MYQKNKNDVNEDHDDDDGVKKKKKVMEKVAQECRIDNEAIEYDLIRIVWGSFLQFIDIGKFHKKFFFLSFSFSLSIQFNNVCTLFFPQIYNLFCRMCVPVSLWTGNER